VAQAVQDDLDGRDMRAGQRRQRLFARLDTHAVRLDAALGHHLVQRVVHRVGRIHRRRRAVQLDQVERLDAEVAARPVVPLAEVRADVVLRHLLDPAAHLGRHEDVAAFGEEPADQALAAPVAVDVGRVEERDAGVGRRVQHRQGVVLVDLAPVGAELPAAEPDDGHLAAQPGDLPVLHAAIQAHRPAYDRRSWP
jgi:hypothetical protein